MSKVETYLLYLERSRVNLRIEVVSVCTHHGDSEDLISLMDKIATRNGSVKLWVKKEERAMREK